MCNRIKHPEVYARAYFFFSVHYGIWRSHEEISVSYLIAERNKKSEDFFNVKNIR